MFRSVFHKILAVFLVVLLLCFSIAAVFFNFAINKYVVEQRTQVLNVYGQKILSALDIVLKNRLDPMSSFIFQNLLEGFANNTSSLIWIADDRGYLFAYSSIPGEFANKLNMVRGIYQLPEQKQYAVSESDGVETEIGTFYGLFEDTGMKWLTVKIPFYFPDIRVDGRELRGNVLMHTPIPEIQKTGYTIFSLLIPAIFISLIISYILVYFLSKRIINPLKQMTDVAREISSGKWSTRIHLNGNDEIKVLADTFNQMLDNLENLEKMRRDFIANVSHELRTPMTSINGFIEGILDGTIPEDKQKYYLSIVKDEVKRLYRLVSDLLDIARMEAGEIKLNPAVFDVCEVIRLSVIQLQQFIESKNINFRASFEQEVMYVYADRDAIQRVLINLIHNAIKFTQENGNISVSVRNVKNKVEISVSDDGQGIPPEDIPFVFDRFHKADKSRSKDKTSVGLGLYIVKNLLNAHKENITVESELGKGTTFTFWLPAA
ncbi:integral membrane sensor signal transduction histidine kinase [Thermoclostridium stercorarium subsp. stercorarium DSM 8532]|uniref:histidine kinase n=4 Tax=Thermoclostridium stercorarium TaxID=1510 RepID=L7VND6_THES1|nr:integral membrane sensor signal transduction histidine kinase [Thermoclostridium stercorarium subsp. stercorarium DSM 8532]AGI39191.1 histidine kinase [Thermoclostridium stercorarium subsp. stercorarium DSM 8532]ANW98536.1 histidine kinase [Thermoclostridium stercorarium subsp. thermolacticum DSM 2910]ANX01071.1 histidine kinase [Thermoclostridium stercorarium subsp. leptospartum DSM 9219]